MNTTTALVRALRDAGLTQTEIARRTRVGQSRLSRWEAGVVPSAAEAVLRLKELHDEVKAKQAAEATAQGVPA